VQLLADGLRRIHSISIVDCPFDKRITVRLAEAKANMVAGRVDTDDFDPVRQGRTPADLYAELLRTVPATEDLVFTHGDYCLPNVLLDGVALTGFIDWGYAGVADRHQDLAMAVRSITWNLGPEWVQPFLDAYGLPGGPNPAKIEFFQLLDEFF
jgi:aminoglycoside phosphotransferase